MATECIYREVASEEGHSRAATCALQAARMSAGTVIPAISYGGR